MSKTWLVNSRAIAKKVRNAARSSAQQIKDCGANRECPNCHHCIDNSDVSPEWPGLPIGVKFDPSDVELLEHLAAKCGVGNSKPHMFIDEFISTLEGDQGICYTHPENLPGSKKDGSSVHFFHRTTNAYATGQRKRRKIHIENSLNEEHVRWHKTGKTRPVIENGVQKGCRKIMVLYNRTKKGTKPEKSNWVVHQYHLGTDEDEKDSEYVVSKVFYQQPKQTKKTDDTPVIEEPDNLILESSPRTPLTNPPHPPRLGSSIVTDDVADGNKLLSSAKELLHSGEASHVPQPAVKPEDDQGYLTWLAGESQGIEDPGLDCINDSLLLCKEDFSSSAFSRINNVSCTGFSDNANDVKGNNCAACGISDLENLEFDTPPDAHLADLQFSDESIFGWLDRF